MDFSRQELTSTDVKFWRLKSIPALYGFGYLCLRLHLLKKCSFYSIYIQHNQNNVFYTIWCNSADEKWNESGFMPLLCTYRLNWARRTSWGWWDEPDDTALQTQDIEIRTMEVWGRARHLSVAEAPHNTEFYEWMGKKHFGFFQTTETGKRTPNSSVKGSCANHYSRAPAQLCGGDECFFENNHN